MQKKEFTKKVAEKTGLNVAEASKVLSAFVEVITEAYNNDERVYFNGLGVFTKYHKKAHSAHDFSTGKSFEAPAKDVLKFKMSSSFNQAKE